MLLFEANLPLVALASPPLGFQTSPVVWYCLTKACRLVSVDTHALVQST